MSNPAANNLTDTAPPLGYVTGQPRFWLRIEGAAALAVAVTFYARGGHSWILFALCFLLPDVTFLAYLAGSRAGAIGYNIAHSYVLPLTMATALHLLGKSAAAPLIWIAHIGLDRFLGYGLKYPAGFADTHLGPLGRGGRAPQPTKNRNETA
jgi:hypothetical protein